MYANCLLFGSKLISHFLSFANPNITEGDSHIIQILYIRMALFEDIQHKTRAQLKSLWYKCKKATDECISVRIPMSVPLAFQINNTTWTMAENPRYKRKGSSALLISNGMKAKYFQSLLPSVGMPIMVGTGVSVRLVSTEWQRFPWCEEEGRPCALLMLTSSHETSLVSTTGEKHGRGSTEDFSCLPGNLWGLWKSYEVCASLYLSVSGWTTKCKGSQAVLCMFMSVQRQNTPSVSLANRQAIKSYFFPILHMTTESSWALLPPYTY